MLYDKLEVYSSSRYPGKNEFWSEMIYLGNGVAARLNIQSFFFFPSSFILKFLIDNSYAARQGYMGLFRDCHPEVASNAESLQTEGSCVMD